MAEKKVLLHEQDATLCVERSLIDEFIEIDLHASVKRRVQISTVSKMY